MNVPISQIKKNVINGCLGGVLAKRQITTSDLVRLVLATKKLLTFGLERIYYVHA